MLHGTEDCLMLDVYAPPVGTKPKSVMVFIHGGCFSIGGKNMYSGADLVDAGAGDVLVVVINYRLGVFGFLGAE